MFVAIDFPSINSLKKPNKVSRKGKETLFFSYCKIIATFKINFRIQSTA